MTVSTFSDFVLYFTLYSVMGWVCEVIYCSVPAKKFINRGFLAGPYCPIYGFGALIILFLLRPFTENLPLLFLFAVIATILLEYVTSWGMEKLFGIRWWDYSDKKLNLDGRICLENSLMFGALGVVLTYLVHPFALQLIMVIGSEYKRVLASLLFAVIAIDLVTTLNALYKLDERVKKLKAALESNAIEKIRSLAARENPGRRLLAAFPNMKHQFFGERLSVFIEKLKDTREEVRESIWKTSRRWIQQKTCAVGETIKPFAHGLNFYKLFWIFFISSITGYVVETIFCFVTLGYIESRQGLIYGPFSPVYGLGAVIMVVFLKRLEKRRDILVFAGSAVIGGAFEFLCSFLQEKAFGTVSWDYSQEAYSIGGRTSLLYMFFWGILGLFLIKVVYPAMSRFVERIPNRSGQVITWILICLMSLNMLVSAAAVTRWSQRSDGIAPQNSIAEYLDSRYPNDFLEEVYPNMEKINNPRP